MPELVSILIPAYNAEKTIKDTITSAIKQTWSKKEIIIVDDGSRDKTLQVAKRFESRNVKVVTQDNMGACSARNHALSFAQGDYIQWLDADDLLSPEKLSRQLSKRDIDPSELILYTSAYGSFYFLPNRAKFNANSLWLDLLPVDWLLAKFNEGIWMNPTAWLVSRKLTELGGAWDERLSFSGDDDGEYMCRLVVNSEKVEFVSEAQCYYRIGNSSSLSWRRSHKALESFFLSTCLCIQHLRRLEDSERTRIACSNLLQNRLCYFYPKERAILAKMDTIANKLGGKLQSPMESRKFKLIRKLTGRQIATFVKNASWRARVGFYRNRERIVGALKRYAASENN